MMDIAAIGHVLLYAAFGFALAALVLSTLHGLRRTPGAPASSRRALYLCLATTASAALLLLLALASRRFELAYVASYTSQSTPPHYSFAALWAGMEGSLLFWTTLTSAYGAVAVSRSHTKRPDLTPPATAVIALVLAYFLGMLLTVSDPFARSSPIPIDGAGLNPLLQSPFMTIHPVLLYLGFTGLVVPFAFGTAALIAGRLDARWLTTTRRWTMAAWGFLTAGIVLGAAWAYSELGWGGYWAWDPVENASFLPWLVATAFLHSVMIQERRGMLKIWNVALVLAAYALAVFGTFLTRSGILTSVHTFTESPVGKMLLPMLGLILVGAFALMGWRFEKLRSPRRLESLASREAAFLFNNLLLVAVAFTVAWGTLYPIVVEWLRGERISVGPPFFNAVVSPLGLGLLALAGIGPLIAWRRASLTSLRRQFTIPAAAGAGALSALLIAGIRSPAALAAFTLCAFTATATIGEFVRAARAHGGGPRGLVRAFGRNRRRYGGYVVHVGVILIFLGLAGGAFRQTWTGEVSVGSSFEIGDYRVTYTDASRYRTDEKMVVMAVMDVSKGSRPVGTLRPQRNFHLAQRQPQSEVGIRTTLSEDLYIVLTQMDEGGRAQLRAWVNPLVAWIWIGGAVMVLGSVVAIGAREPSPKPATATREREVVEAAV